MVLPIFYQCRLYLYARLDGMGKSVIKVIRAFSE